MIYPFFENRSILLQYFAIWLVYALVQILIFQGLVAESVSVLLTDSLLQASLMGVLGILLHNVIRYGNFEILALHQRLLNYFALATIAIGAWLALCFYGIDLIFGETTAAKFIPLLPVRAFIGLLVYLLMVQQFRNSIANELKAEQPAEPEGQSMPPAPAEVNDGTEKNAEVESQTSAQELLERIAVKSGSKIHVVMIQEIIYMQADGDYVQIVSTNGKYLKEQTMKYFETHLPANQFVRVHRSIIVNVEMISRIELYEKQSQQLTLKNGQHIKTSPSGYKALRAVLNL